MSLATNTSLKWSLNTGWRGMKKRQRAKRVKRETESTTAADKAACKRVAEGGYLFLQSARSLSLTHTHTNAVIHTPPALLCSHSTKGRRAVGKNAVMRLVSRITGKKYLFHHLAPFFLHKLSSCLSPKPCSICPKQASIMDEGVRSSLCVARGREGESECASM